MKFKPKPHEPQDITATFRVKLQTDEGGKFAEFTRSILTETVTSAGVGVQSLLATLQNALDVKRDEIGVITADLVLPIPKGKKSDKLKAARKLLSKEPKEPKRPKSETVSAMNRWKARPRYTNAYHLVAIHLASAIVGEDEGTSFRFRLLERYSFKVERKKGKETVTEDSHAYESLQAETVAMIFQCWMDSDMPFVSASFRNGVRQKCAESLNSHIALLCDDPDTGFPSLSERDPDTRETQWLAALERIVNRTESFPYKTARELYPGEYAEDDKHGDRPINVDPDWRKLVQSPEPGRLPATTNASTAIGIFRRTVEERYNVNGKTVIKTRTRYYGCLPVFEKISPDSPLGRLADDTRCFWWQKHRKEFEPLRVTSGNLPDGNTAIVVPLVPSQQKSSERRFKHFLESSVWDLCIGSIVEKPAEYRLRRSWRKNVWRKGENDEKGKRVDRPVKASRTEWWLHLALRREVKPELRPNVLGVHFGIDAIHWCLMSREGEVFERGGIEGNPILGTGLARKGELEEIQKRHGSVKDRVFGDELMTATYEVARSILMIAWEKDANLALENINWVDKSGKDGEANIRFSMWNYSRLPSVTKWLGLRQFESAIPTVAELYDFFLQFTCPACRACRQKGQKEENADTWRKGEILNCRKCGFEGIVPSKFQAELVAEAGVRRANDLAEKDRVANK
ncbi:MAG: hypothetical protein Q8P86_02170 [bacterium]|nr:hypothetical protein [bacterium]